MIATTRKEMRLKLTWRISCSTLPTKQRTHESRSTPECICAKLLYDIRNYTSAIYTPVKSVPAKGIHSGGC